MGEDEMGSIFANPIILMPKNDYMKLVIDARYVNSVTDLTNYSQPLEPVQMIITMVNSKVFLVSDLSCAHCQVPLNPDKRYLVSKSVENSKPTNVDSMACADSQSSSAD